MRKFNKALHAGKLITALLISLQFLSGCILYPNLEKPALPPSQKEETTPALLITDSITLETPVIQTGKLFTPIGLLQGESLAIHSSPAANAPIIGSIPATSINIKISGEPQIDEKTTWIMADYNQVQGWVDLNNLAIHEGELPEELIALGQLVLDNLQAYDYNLLVDLIHPDHCLRFSPYSYLSENNLIFCPEQLRDLVSSDEKYVWGEYDGTGNLIFMIFPEYHQNFVYDSNYIKPEIIGFNVEVSSGNAINNIAGVYPGGVMIEYYFSGFDPKYGGLDWRSIRLVFIQDNLTWYLVAIIHGEWTI
ncbi:MAG: hypothetical protein K8R16_04605 [Anaerolineales bacterium]|nr:hypothetical protein [Anaerolineales bacterium]